MSRYSPTVAPAVVPSFAESLRDALALGMQTYQQARGLREQREARQRDDQRADEYLKIQQQNAAINEGRATQETAERTARLHSQGYRLGEAAPGPWWDALKLAPEQPVAGPTLAQPVAPIAQDPQMQAPQARLGTFDRAARQFRSALPEPEEVQVAPNLVHMAGNIRRAMIEEGETARRREEEKAERERLAKREEMEYASQLRQNEMRLGARLKPTKEGETAGSGGHGDAATPKLGQPTEMERKADYFLDGVTEAVAALGTMGAPAVVPGIASKVPLIGNSLSPEERQLLDLYSEVLGEAHLRLTSGATITPADIAQAGKIYTPRIGDSPKVQIAKARRREQLAKAYERVASRARASYGIPTSPFAGRGAVEPRDPAAAGDVMDRLGGTTPTNRPPEQDEMDAAAAEYQEALTLGANPAEARALYERALTAIARKHGRMK